MRLFTISAVAAALALSLSSLALGATVADAAEPASSPSSLDVSAPAAPTITSPAGRIIGKTLHASVSTDHFTISGTGEPGAIVTLTVRGAAVSCAAPAVVSATGTWSCALVNDARYFTSIITSRQTDRAGNTSAPGPSQSRLHLTQAAAFVPPTPPTPPTPNPTPTPTPAPAPNPTTPSPLPTPTPTPTPTPPPTTTPPAPTVPPATRPTGPEIGPPSPARPVPTASPTRHQGAPSIQLPTLALPLAGAESEAPTLNSGSAPSAIVPDENRGGPGTATDAPRDRPNAPTALTEALPTVQQVLANPFVLVSAAVAGIVLLLLVAFPAELLNSTLAENYERLFGRFPRFHPHWLDSLRLWLAGTPVTGGLALTAAAALIFGFADPQFGFDIASLRLFLACAIALFIVGYVANAATGWIVRERWHLGTKMELKPLGLILTIVGVVISRILGFSPGFLIGLILGIALTGVTTGTQRARTVLIRSGMLLGFGVAAWIGYSVMIAENQGNPGSFLEALTIDTLVAVATEGLTALVVGLLPLRYLDGQELYAKSLWLWAGSYLTTLIAFLTIVLPTVANWGVLGASLWGWIAVLVAFAAVSVGLYLYFRRVAARRQEFEEERIPVPQG